MNTEKQETKKTFYSFDEFKKEYFPEEVITIKSDNLFMTNLALELIKEVKK